MDKRDLFSLVRVFMRANLEDIIGEGANERRIPALAAPKFEVNASEMLSSERPRRESEVALPRPQIA